MTGAAGEADSGIMPPIHGLSRRPQCALARSRATSSTREALTTGGFGQFRGFRPIVSVIFLLPRFRVCDPGIVFGLILRKPPIRNIIAIVGKYICVRHGKTLDRVRCLVPAGTAPHLQWPPPHFINSTPLLPKFVHVMASLDGFGLRVLLQFGHGVCAVFPCLIGAALRAGLLIVRQHLLVRLNGAPQMDRPVKIKKVFRLDCSGLSRPTTEKGENQNE